MLSRYERRMIRHAPLLLFAAAIAAPAAAQERAVPYWASIASGQAMMRTGPERTYPGIWLYQRRDLPVKVLQVLGDWRRIREQDGTTGWMLSTLLSKRRTAIVTGEVRTVRQDPSAGAKAMWRVETGVVGRLEGCDGQWCRISFGKQSGYLEQSALWGTDPGETIED
jgi:SH3-like domain-containing protein